MTTITGFINQEDLQQITIEERRCLLEYFRLVGIQIGEITEMMFTGHCLADFEICNGWVYVRLTTDWMNPDCHSIELSELKRMAELASWE